MIGLIGLSIIVRLVHAKEFKKNVKFVKELEKLNCSCRNKAKKHLRLIFSLKDCLKM